MQILWSILLSIPVAGSWLASSIFGGEFPGDVIIGRLYILHVLLLPALLAALLLALVGLRLRHGPTRWPGPRRTGTTVVGQRMFPRVALKQGGLFALVCALIALLGGLFQINPVWIFGPAQPAAVSAASQPAWYVMFLDGAVRLMPPWEVTIPIGDGYTIHPIFWAAVVLPALLVALPIVYPFIGSRVRRDHREHHQLRAVTSQCAPGIRTPARDWNGRRASATMSCTVPGVRAGCRSSRARTGPDPR